MRTRIRYAVNRIDEEYFDGEDTKTEMIRARVEPELKCQAEEVFAGLGLSPTEAITLFYRQVTLHHGLPFAVKSAQCRDPRRATAGSRRKGTHRIRRPGGSQSSARLWPPESPDTGTVMAVLRSGETPLVTFVSN